MDQNIKFNEGVWQNEINVKDFVNKNITPYEGDASFLCGPSERTKKIWDICKQALKEESENNGVRKIDNKVVSGITSHKAGYIDKENELIVGLQTDELLKRAMKPYGGIIMWRSFVYGANHKGEDRVKQAVSEFKGMDGKFRDNVILQSKNGPLDFQPREPYAPIFDNIKQTPQIAELQITQEYLGQSKHLTYLAPMWKEFFDFVNPDKLVGISGVANIGDDANWCGHPFSQANWYAFGRLAWNPSLTAEEIAHEWLVQTYENQDEKFTKPVEMMMMTSREACVNYMMPLGLHHIFKFDHHYGPEPDGFIASYPLEWCPVYYHKADAKGIGFDRSSKGTDAVGQYPEPYRSLYDNIETCPEEYLLWFHHVAWNYKMKSGSTLWQELCMKYNMGVAMVEVYRDFWHTSAKQYMKGHEQEWQHTDSLLNVQLENAKEWRDTCLKYFQNYVSSTVDK